MASPNQRVRAIRAFRHRGDELGIGSVLDLDTPTANELRQANKLEFVPSDTRPVVVPLARRERPVSAESRTIADLSAQVDRLTALVEKLSGGKKAAA